MSAWSPVAPCTPQTCVTDAAPVVGRAHRLARYAAGLCGLLAGVALAPVAQWCGTARRDRLIRLWARGVAGAFGVRIQVRVRVPAGAGCASPPAPAHGVLVVANHVSWLDILLVAAVRPGRMLAKSEIGAWPVLGRLVARGGTLFIDRDRLKTLPRTVGEIAAALRGGGTVIAFPEGSTWCGRRQGRFRPAVFQAALDAAVPVQPVVVRYRLAGGEPTTAAAFVGEDTLLASVRRVVAVRGLVAEVALLPQIPARGHAERRSLARAAQSAVADPGQRCGCGHGFGDHGCGSHGNGDHGCGDDPAGNDTGGPGAARSTSRIGPPTLADRSGSALPPHRSGSALRNVWAAFTTGPPVPRRAGGRRGGRGRIAGR